MEYFGKNLTFFCLDAGLDLAALLANTYRSDMLAIFVGIEYNVATLFKLCSIASSTVL